VAEVEGLKMGQFRTGLELVLFGVKASLCLSKVKANLVAAPGKGFNPRGLYISLINLIKTCIQLLRV